MIACHSVGIAAIGRPSNASGAATIAGYLKNRPERFPIVVLGENDKKSDDIWPGKSGAIKVAQQLKQMLCEDEALGWSVFWALPDERFKDVREWVVHERRNFAAPDVLANILNHVEANKTEVELRKKARAEKTKQNLASELFSLVDLSRVWQDQHGTAYYQLKNSSIPVQSQAFEFHLIARFHQLDESRRLPGSEAIKTAIRGVIAVARDSRSVIKKCSTYIRSASLGRKTYIQVGDNEDTILSIDSDGWQIEEKVPVKFIQTPRMLPLAEPAFDREIEVPLHYIFNFASEDQEHLLLDWLTGVLMGRGPFPVLLLTGEQGTGKSTAARMLKELVDPTAAPLRGEPENQRDLMIYAEQNYCLCFDNLSFIPSWLSDCLCRISTGGGFATRQLYTDSEEKVFDSMRPIIINSINDIVVRPDLLERCIVVEFKPIPDNRRRTEARMWQDFEEAKPLILGKLFDRIKSIYQNLDRVERMALKLPRMADYVSAMIAAGMGEGKEPSEIIARYLSHREQVEQINLESDDVANAIANLLEEVPYWEGSSHKLFNDLRMRVSESVLRSRNWPDTPRTLTWRLKNLSPILRRNGIEYVSVKDEISHRNTYKLFKKTS
ncbi:MAG: ATP-binding protein [Gemmatales bacterium]|nr:MAG: ATP-binding protein [Gemmatales bacterium]